MSSESGRVSVLERREPSSGTFSVSNKRFFLTKSKFVFYDLLAVFCALIFSYGFRSGADNAVLVSAIFLCSSLAWFLRNRIYNSRHISRRTDEIRRVFDACLKSAASVVLILYVFKVETSRGWLLLATIFSFMFVYYEREVIRQRFQKRRKEGKLHRKVLLIGSNWESESIKGMIDGEKSLGYTIVDSVDPEESAGSVELTTVTLAAARKHGVDGVIIAASSIDVQSSNRLIRDLVDAGVHVELSSTLADLATDRLTMRALGRFPVLYVEPRLRNGWRASAKRLFDLSLSAFALLVFSPVILTIMLLVKFTSEGPVLFRQERIGQDARPFDVFKFRTMVVDAEERLAALTVNNEGSGPLFKMKEDPRITKVGKVLRKLSLDELPQLLNVVKGEMSLVGPRPALQSEMAQWNTELYGRLRVKPGITGMWQVSGRSGTTFSEYTRLDLYYVDNWSLWVDLSIILKTIPAVLKSDGAY